MTATCKCCCVSFKAILIEPSFSGCSYAEHPTFKTDSQLFGQQLKSVQATVDGVNIPNLDKYLVQSPVVNIMLTQNNIVGAPAGPSK